MSEMNRFNKLRALLEKLSEDVMAVAWEPNEEGMSFYKKAEPVIGILKDAYEAAHKEICRLSYHDFGPDQCGMPAHDYCYHCGTTAYQEGWLRIPLTELQKNDEVYFVTGDDANWGYRYKKIGAEEIAAIAAKEAERREELHHAISVAQKAD